VVTADGQIRHADDSRYQDLLWALSGGGGNFGVVTAFEFDLQQVDPTVQFGLFFWDADRFRDAHAMMRDLVRALPLSMNAIQIAAFTAPEAPFVPPEFQQLTGTALLLVGFGDADGHREVTERIRRTVPPLFDFLTPMPYVALQQLLDDANRWGLYSYDKGGYLADLDDGAIEALATVALRKGSPLSAIPIYRLDGAYSTVPQEATAFSGGRSPRYFCTLLAVVATAAELPAERAWARDVYDALRPHMLGDATYVNVLCGDDGDRLTSSYGPGFQRLREIKGRYDPDNVFRGNANIRPLVTS
jgi:hypothetical protein